jgi:hypothetical protein
MRLKICVYILLYSLLLNAQKPELIAVFTFKSQGMDAKRSLIVVDYLRNEIKKHKKFDVIDYQAMKKILLYNGFEEGYICDELVCALVMGEFLSVEKIVQGSIIKKDNTYTISVKFVNLVKSENILTITENYTGPFEGFLTEAVPDIGKMIIRSSTKDLRKKRGAFVTLIGGLGIAVAVPVAILMKPKDKVPDSYELDLDWSGLKKD